MTYGAYEASAPGPAQGSVGTGSTELQYAGFWRRLGAWILDAIVVNVITYILAFVIGLAVGAGGGSENVAGVIGAVIGFLVPLLYWSLLESSTMQASLGKKALGIKVTDLQGNRISFPRALVRYVAKFISALILLIGFFMAGFTQKKQALHDMIAKTLVVLK